MRHLRNPANYAPGVEDDGGGHTWWAFVDETLWAPRTGRGCYVLAASIVAHAELEPARRRLVGLLLARQRRLHWRDESVPRKRKIAASVADAAARHLVVVGRPMDPARQERARRKCLEHLLHLVADAGVRQVVLEARTPRLDRRDMTLIEALRGRRAMPGTLRVALQRAETEPLLWLPDVIAGCLRAELTSSGSEAAPALAARIRRYEIDL